MMKFLAYFWLTVMRIVVVHHSIDSPSRATNKARMVATTTVEAVSQVKGENNFGFYLN